MILTVGCFENIDAERVGKNLGFWAEALHRSWPLVMLKRSSGSMIFRLSFFWISNFFIPKILNFILTHEFCVSSLIWLFYFFNEFGMFIMKTCPWLIHFVKVLCDFNVTNLFHVFKVFIPMNKISFRFLFYFLKMCVLAKCL